ncbi:unnamed protein product, partial [Prorocentrum cordatum]
RAPPAEPARPAWRGMEPAEGPAPAEPGARGQLLRRWCPVAAAWLLIGLAYAQFFLEEFRVGQPDWDITARDTRQSAGGRRQPQPAPPVMAEAPSIVGTAGEQPLVAAEAPSLPSSAGEHRGTKHGIIVRGP